MPPIIDYPKNRKLLIQEFHKIASHAELKPSVDRVKKMLRGSAQPQSPTPLNELDTRSKPRPKPKLETD